MNQRNLDSHKSANNVAPSGSPLASRADVDATYTDLVGSHKGLPAPYDAFWGHDMRSSKILTVLLSAS
jgi:hypothetical protein